MNPGFEFFEKCYTLICMCYFYGFFKVPFSTSANQLLIESMHCWIKREKFKIGKKNSLTTNNMVFFEHILRNFAYLFLPRDAVCS